MEIRTIEEKAYVRMRQAFENFAREMEELLGTPGVGKEWLDNEDVCMLLHIQKRTLQYYRDSGKLPFAMIGNKCYYKVPDVEKLISDSRIKQ